MQYSNADDVLRRVADVTEFLGIDLKGVNQAGIFNNTPLAVVISWEDYEAASLLVEAGANVNAEVEGGDTALHRAVLFNQPKIVEMLLEKGATSAVKNGDGLTPLELARTLGYADIAKLLAR
jgi:ankyrin repeat protein